MQLWVHRKGVNRTKGGSEERKSSFEGESPGGMLLAGVKLKKLKGVISAASLRRKTFSLCSAASVYEQEVHFPLPDGWPCKSAVA